MADAALGKAEIKQLLMRSRSEPVSCAVATAEDGKSALLELDKVKQPRALLQALQKDHPKAVNPRFGTVEVDEALDPKLARFRLNRPSAGLAKRLAKLLKGTGTTKVEILLEDGSVAEGAGAEEDEDAAPAAEAAPPPPPPAATPAPPRHDAGQLTRALKTLAERIAGVADAGGRAALVTLAVQGQAALKAADLPGAEAAILALGKALGEAAGHAPPQTPLLPIWRAAKEQADGKLEALGRELRSLGDEDADQVAEFGLFGLTGGRETVGLMTALTEYDGAAADRRTAAAAGLRTAVARYRQMLDANPMVELLDENPFGVTPDLRGTLGGALREIEAGLA